MSALVKVSRVRAPSRVTGLDAARVLATLGIVWVHTSEIQGQDASVSTLGRFGTSFYVLAAIFLSARGHLRRPETKTLDVVKKRAQRLLVPFLVWCAIYATFYLSTMVPQGHSVDSISRYWGPLFGTAPHLWFLPFAFVAGALASYGVPRLMRLPGWLLVPMGIALTLGTYACVYGWGYLALDKEWTTAVRLHRLDRWLEEAPLTIGGIFGVAIYGRYLPQLSRMGRRNRHRLSLYAFIAFAVVELAYAIFLDDLGVIFWNRVRFMANIAGAFWLVAFMSARDGKWISKLAPLGRATYFAYLSHQLILDSTKRLLTFVPGHGSLWFSLFSSLGIFLLAVGLGLWVQRVRLLKWLSP